MARRLFMALAIILALILSGCGWINPAPGTAETQENGPEPENEHVADPVRRVSQVGGFSVRYDPGSSLNPLTGTNHDNILVTFLMYESLFVLGENFEAEPNLAVPAERYTEDNITYTIAIRPGIAMSDGSTLTADDVAYTLRQAMQRGRFVNRLRVIDNVFSDGELTVTITLRYPSARLTSLLDVPIIKSGSSGSRVPPGTGPFIYTGDMRLVSFAGHRDYENLPFNEVYLIECDDDDVTGLFSDGVLSLIWDDPAGTFDMRVNRPHDLRFYDTTTMQFLGFNTRNPALQNAEIRRAVGLAVDREYITETIMPGRALMAPIALSPAYRLYDSMWEELEAWEREVLREHRRMHLLQEISMWRGLSERDPAAQIRDQMLESLTNALYELDEYGAALFEDPLVEMSVRLAQAGVADPGHVSYQYFFDIYSADYVRITIDFIVNEENRHRVRAAHNIADTLRRNGFDITVRELPWEAFMHALQTGDFDMYYGGVTLGADFDFSPLLLPDGRLNFGNTGSAVFREYIDAFLTAQTDEEERQAAQRLCNVIRRNAPFIPILYQRHAVYTPQGAVSGTMPSQSNIFRGLTDWVVDLAMLT